MNVDVGTEIKKKVSNSNRPAAQSVRCLVTMHDVGTGNQEKSFQASDQLLNQLGA